MAKRISDSEKWRDPWFSELSTELKILWLYILDNCNHAGIWKLNQRLAEFETGVNIPWGEGIDRVPEKFRERVFFKGECWFIPKFLKWQYGEMLTKGRAYCSAYEIIECKGFLEELKRVYGGYASPIGRGKAKATATAKATAMATAQAMAMAKAMAKEGMQGETLPKEDKPLTDIQKIVTVYKLCMGYEKNDKAWDKLNFARCAGSAKKLLDFMGNWKDAGDCIQDVYERLTGKGLSVTIETIVKHAAEWKKDQREKEAKNGVLSLSSHGSL